VLAGAQATGTIAMALITISRAGHAASPEAANPAPASATRPPATPMQRADELLRWGSGHRRTEGDIHHGYLDMPSTPLFAFGHGLSHATFEYGPLRLASDSVDVGGEARVSLTVTNTGKRRGTEIVQLYAESHRFRRKKVAARSGAV
jgi:hypothetical protein